MPTLPQRGMDFLSARMAAATDETVRVDRPSTGEVIPEMQATPGTQDFEIQQGDTSIMSYRSYDWLVDVTNYDFGAGPVEPAEGDRISVVRKAKVQVYEVLRIPGGDSWRYSDPYDMRYRIHTKLIEKE